MNLADFEPKPHPAKRVLKSNGVKISTVARALDLSFPYVSSILSGAIRATPETEEKLSEIVKELEGGEA